MRWAQAEQAEQAGMGAYCHSCAATAPEYLIWREERWQALKHWQHRPGTARARARAAVCAQQHVRLCAAIRTYCCSSRGCSRTWSARSCGGGTAPPGAKAAAAAGPAACESRGAGRRGLCSRRETTAAAVVGSSSAADGERRRERRAASSNHLARSARTPCPWRSQPCCWLGTELLRSCCLHVLQLLPLQAGTPPGAPAAASASHTSASRPLSNTLCPHRGLGLVWRVAEHCRARQQDSLEYMRAAPHDLLFACSADLLLARQILQRWQVCATDNNDL